MAVTPFYLAIPHFHDSFCYPRDLQGLDAKRYIVKAHGVLICISEMIVVGLIICIVELAATKGVTLIQILFSEPPFPQAPQGSFIVRQCLCLSRVCIPLSSLP